MSIAPEGGWNDTFERMVPPTDIQEASPRKRATPDPLEGKISVTELKGNIARIYNLLARFGFKDDLVFAPDDCQEEADGLMAIVNRWPQARIALRLIGPLAAIAAAVEKVEILVKRRNAKRQDTGTEPVSEPASTH